MMDIRLALKTVHENIHRFGGDQNRLMVNNHKAKWLQPLFEVKLKQLNDFHRQSELRLWATQRGP